MYAREAFTDEEISILSRFFTNTDLPVFAIVNLPEIVKGAMFARYSRTHKSLRRLFLDEFYEQPEIGIQSIADQVGNGEQGIGRAEKLYETVFVEYGDDSVAQLGGAHVACEQASAILTKVLERGRLAAYLEQSTRYIYYDVKLKDADGTARFRYQTPPEIAQGPLADRYLDTMDRLFDSYSFVVRALTSYFQNRFPQGTRETRGAYRSATRARACDTARGLLPASTTSNLGIFATGQAYEALLMRMNASPLAEAREYSQMMLVELQKVIAGFLSRVDVEDRGVAWSDYFRNVAHDMGEIVESELKAADGREFDLERDEVRLLDYDPDTEIRLVAAALYPYSNRSEEDLLQTAISMNDEERRKVISTYIGDRMNRRHKPGRGMERVYYRFDVLSDFGSFRDLQRHRMMTIDWQRLTSRHGYATPPEIEDVGSGVASRWHDSMSEMSELYWDVLTEHGADVAQYVVPFGYRIRYNIQMNARQAFHMLELRTGASGHSDYRRICLKMHALIRDQAGHAVIADAMKYVDAKDYGLGRLSSELRQSQRRQPSLFELP
ncbi:MAG: thymidylate synthase [Chloroflexi bacterium]|nr:thymidylate synthase [Chloroflexota bacterium]